MVGHHLNPPKVTPLILYFNYEAIGLRYHFHNTKSVFRHSVF